MTKKWKENSKFNGHKTSKIKIKIVFDQTLECGSRKTYYCFQPIRMLLNFMHYYEERTIKGWDSFKNLDFSFEPNFKSSRWEMTFKSFNFSFLICFNYLFLFSVFVVHVNWILFCVIVDVFKFQYLQKLCNICYLKIAEHEIIILYRFLKMKCRWNRKERSSW